MTEEDLRMEVHPEAVGLQERHNETTGNCTNPLCDYWHPPACQITNANRDANSVKSASSAQQEAEDKWWQRICCFVEEFEASGLRIPGQNRQNPSRCHGRAHNSWDRSVHSGVNLKGAGRKGPACCGYLTPKEKCTCRVRAHGGG